MWKYKKKKNIPMMQNWIFSIITHYTSLHNYLINRNVIKTAFIWKKYIVSLLILLPILVNLIKVINPPPQKKWLNPNVVMILCLICNNIT